MKEEIDKTKAIAPVKEDFVEHYFTSTNGLNIIIVNFIKVDRHLVIHLDDKEEVTSVSIEKNLFIPLFNSNDEQLFRGFTLKKAEKKYEWTDKYWEELMLAQMKLLVQPITDSYGIFSALDLMGINPSESKEIKSQKEQK